VLEARIRAPTTEQRDINAAYYQNAKPFVWTKAKVHSVALKGAGRPNADIFDKPSLSVDRDASADSKVFR
jgi:hypothetical protein